MNSRIRDGVVIATICTFAIPVALVIVYRALIWVFAG